MSARQSASTKASRTGVPGRRALGFRSLGFRVQDLGFRVQGLGFRSWDFKASAFWLHSAPNCHRDIMLQVPEQPLSMRLIRCQEDPRILLRNLLLILLHVLIEAKKGSVGQASALGTDFPPSCYYDSPSILVYWCVLIKLQIPILTCKCIHILLISLCIFLLVFVGSCMFITLITPLLIYIAVPGTATSSSATGRQRRSHWARCCGRRHVRQGALPAVWVLS